MLVPNSCVLAIVFIVVTYNVALMAHKVRKARKARKTAQRLSLARSLAYSWLPAEIAQSQTRAHSAIKAHYKAQKRLARTARKYAEFDKWLSQMSQDLA